MGREWYWSRTIRRGEREKETTPPGCMSGVLQFFDLHQLLFTTTAAAAHYGRTEEDSFPQQHQSPHHSLKGVEAPRNSLELDDEATVSSASLVVIAGKEEYGNPIGIQVVPRKTTTSAVEQQQHQEEEKERSSHGSTRTQKGNVVARLMGLDQLPDQVSSPPPTVYYRREPPLSPPLIRPDRQLHQTKKQHKDARGIESAVKPPPRHPLQARNCNILGMPEEYLRSGTRSVPDTPRISSARRSWDADPRLSLQLSNKENVASVVANDLSCFCDVAGDYSSSLSPSPLFSKSKRKNWRHQPDENRSPGCHAREIVKQVSRRIGGHDGDDLDIRSKLQGTTKGPEKKITRAESNKNKTSTTPSGSPRLLEFPKNKSTTPATDGRHIPSSSPELVPKSSPPSPPPPLPCSQSPPIKVGDLVKARTKSLGSAAKCKKASCERFTERLKKPDPTAIGREETFASPYASAQPQNKCRSPSSMATFVPCIRKEPPSSPPPQPQVHVSAPPLLRNAGQLLKCDDRDIREPSSRGASVGADEYRYVRRILERTGVHGRTPLPFAAARWYSPSHPVDPIIFHQLERTLRYPSGPLRRRCNRKLLFHLVDEVLAELLWPYFDTTTWPSRSSGLRSKKKQQPRMLDGETLLDRLWSQIRSFPSADCRVVQDINALVERDLPVANVRRLLLHPSVSDEAESVASDLEAAILDSLVGDATAAMLKSL